MPHQCDQVLTVDWLFFPMLIRYSVPSSFTDLGQKLLGKSKEEPSDCTYWDATGTAYPSIAGTQLQKPEKGGGRLFGEHKLLSIISSLRYLSSHINPLTCNLTNNHFIPSIQILLWKHAATGDRRFVNCE
jgi:hypothetical protein